MPPFVFNAGKWNWQKIKLVTSAEFLWFTPSTYFLANISVNSSEINCRLRRWARERNSCVSFFFLLLSHLESISGSSAAGIFNSSITGSTTRSSSILIYQMIWQEAVWDKHCEFPTRDLSPDSPLEPTDRLFKIQDENMKYEKVNLFAPNVQVITFLLLYFFRVR